MEPVPRFVVRAASEGLSGPEREALKGWLKWTAMLWRNYKRDVDPRCGPLEMPWQRDEEDEEVSDPQLMRWAQAARRSRWPLLREVVAESLRPVVEPETVDRLPLPSPRDALFELLCVVRLLDGLVGRSRHIRWLGHEGTGSSIELGQSGNVIEAPGIECAYQGWLGGEQLADGDLGVECVRALSRHGVVLPRKFDALIRFKTPRLGFNGLLLEAKSGGEKFGDTVYQLKAYRAALRAKMPGPILIWGIVEDPKGGLPLDCEALATAVKLRAPGDDFWLFTSHDEVRPALEALGLAVSPSFVGHVQKSRVAA